MHESNDLDYHVQILSDYYPGHIPDMLKNFIIISVKQASKKKHYSSHKIDGYGNMKLSLTIGVKCFRESNRLFVIFFFSI